MVDLTASVGPDGVGRGRVSQGATDGGPLVFLAVCHPQFVGGRVSHSTPRKGDLVAVDGCGQVQGRGQNRREVGLGASLKIQTHKVLGNTAVLMGEGCACGKAEAIAFKVQELQFGEGAEVGYGPGQLVVTEV